MLARVARLRQRIGESMRALGAVYQNRGLRRLQLAWAAAIIGGWAYVISLAVFAYRQNGAYAVGALAVARWVSSGIAAPIAGVIGDRYPRVRILIASSALRSAMMAVNVTASTIDGVGTFLGPALGGFLLAATSPEIVFFVSAGLLACAAVVVSGVPEGPREPRAEDEEE